MKGTNMGRAGGLVVSVSALYAENLSSIPADSFYILQYCTLSNDKNIRKSGRVWNPIQLS